MSDLITINNIVNRAKIQLQIGGSDFDWRMQIWADEAIRKMNTLSSYGKFATTIPLVDGRGELPCGFFKLLGARPVDSGGCCSPATYIDTIFADECCSRYGFSRSILSGCCDSGEIMEILNGYIHMHYPSDATELQISWAGLNTDDNGMLVIHRSYEIPLYNFLCYQVGISPGSTMTEKQIDRYMRTWSDEASMLIGRENKRQWEYERQWIGITLLNRVKISPKF